MPNATDYPTTDEGRFRLACELARLTHELDQLADEAGQLAATCRVAARRLDDECAWEGADVTTIPAVRVFYEPEHEAAAFVDPQTAALTFSGIRRVGRERIPLWTLFHLDPDGHGVETYDLVGDLTNVDAVVAQAETYLRGVYEPWRE